MHLLFYISIFLGQNGFRQTDKHSDKYYEWDPLIDTLERCVNHINQNASLICVISLTDKRA